MNLYNKKYSFTRSCKIIYDKYYRNNIIIDGKKNIPNKDGYIVISNHMLFVEELLIYNSIFNTNFNIVLTSNICDIFSSIGGKPINYEKNTNYIIESGQKVKNKIRQLVHKKENVLIFPEGMYSQLNKLYQFKKGMFYLAFKNNIPIVPVLCLLKKKKLFCYTNNIKRKFKIKIFKQIFTKDFNNFDDYYNYIYNLMNGEYINFVNNHKGYDLFI